MGSAGSRPRFFALLLPFDRVAAARALAIGAILGLAAAGPSLDSAAHFRFAVALSVLLALWCLHLEWSGVNRVVSAAALVLFAWQLHSAPRSLHDSAALGGGLFVYLVVWVFASYDRQPGLQAMANAALLLSAGIQAKPAVAISCAVLSLVLFLAHVRSEAHPLGLGLLLFTPALLCGLAVFGFGFLNANTLVAAPALLHAAAAGPDHTHIWRYLFFFPLAVIAFRLIRRRFGGPDLAYLAMLATGCAICRTEWPPGALSLEDLFFIAAGGAAALLSTMGGGTGHSSRSARAASMRDAWSAGSPQPRMPTATMNDAAPAITDGSCDVTP